MPAARSVRLPAQPVVPRGPEVPRLLRRRRHPAAHPHIRKHHTAVLFTHDEASALRASGEADLGGLIETLLDERSRNEGEAYDILLLTPVDDQRTVRLGAPIANDKVTESGKPWWWTLSQRYTRLDKLTSGVTRTSQL